MIRILGKKMLNKRTTGHYKSSKGGGTKMKRQLPNPKPRVLRENELVMTDTDRGDLGEVEDRLQFGTLEDVRDASRLLSKTLTRIDRRDSRDWSAR